MSVPLLLTVFGLALLFVGAELLVRGASRAGELLRAPSLIIGLTVVAWGTSAPEVAVSLTSALGDRAGLAVGNALGSNLFNLLVVLGMGALIRPLAVERAFVRRDIPALILATLLAGFLLIDGTLSRVDAAILLVGWVAYSYVLFLHARRSRTVDDLITEAQPDRVTPAAVVTVAVSIVGGLAAMVMGARWLVGGAVELAMYAGVDERVIGLTLVAAGTSLPELAATVVAAARGERDLAVGNAVGSCVFNLLAVLGIAGAAQRESLLPDGIVATDLPLLLAATVLVLPLARSGLRLTRVEGAALLVLYVGSLLLLFGVLPSGPDWMPWAVLAGSAAFALLQGLVGPGRRSGKSS